MALVLHLLKGPPSPVAGATIARELENGDRVLVALVEGAPAPALPEGVTTHRVPEELSYSSLLELIFEADQVIAW